MGDKQLNEVLAEDVGRWLADGLISESVHATLRERYRAREFGAQKLVRYAAVSGGMIALFGVIGLIGAISGSLGFGAFLMLGVGVALGCVGLRLGSDPLGTYEHTAKVVVLLALWIITGGLGLLLAAFDVEEEGLVLGVGSVMLPVMFAVAYLQKNGFLLLLALLATFHWLGSFASMIGRSTYSLSIQDPRWMSVAASIAALVGLVHERHMQDRYPRFHQVYQAVGLTYLNLSLLILTIWDKEAGSALNLGWVVVALVASLAQVGMGAWLINPLWTGFGVTTLAVNLYTRYFETFWDDMHKGVFFLCGGLSLLGLGLGFELWLTRRERKEQAA